MKNVVLIFGLMILLASQGLAQRSLAQAFNIDTLTNADTATTPTLVVKDYGDAVFGVVTDSISGATAGTIYYEGSVDGSTFFTIDTDVINGAGVTYDTYTISGSGWPYFRMKFITTGTQSTAVSPFFSFKAKK